MKDKAVAELANVVKDIIVEGKVFVLEQAPEVVQQLILFKRIQLTAGVCFMLLLLALFGVAIWKLWQVSLDDLSSSDETPVVIGRLLTGIIFPVVCGILVVDIVPPLIAVWFAPKVYLLEYFCSAIK